jgi:hypothetical protein
VPPVAIFTPNVVLTALFRNNHRAQCIARSDRRSLPIDRSFHPFRSLF